ncbi:MAG: hypothetical protein ACYDBS_05545, partial [Acidimicrobiales bacterium]
MESPAHRRAAGLISLALAGTLSLLLLTGITRAPGPAGREGRGPVRSAIVRQPVPPITASSFHIEPVGKVPSDGNGMIPNSKTPTGSGPGPVKPCNYVANAAAGATSAAVNRLIAAKENSITKRYVICLSGTFTAPIHVWSKWTEALLVIEAEPGSSASIRPGQVRAWQVNRNDHDGGIVGAVDLTDSRDVEVEGLSISGYWTNGPTFAPAGILVTVRQGPQRSLSRFPHESACFVKSPDHACAGIYLIDNKISGIVNRADQVANSRADCNNGGVGAYGIAVLSYGNNQAHALQHVVIEGNTVDHTRTGQSETVTVNGDIRDFLVANNTIYDTDNIGLDVIGWEEGTDQARNGVISGNTVANVDTLGNRSYGRWVSGRCRNLPQNAAGIYDDGASHIWINHNTVYNTSQGINIDVETPGRYTDHILVSNNTVIDNPGTALTVPSRGSNPPGMPGRSTVAGQAFVAFYVDAYGARSLVEDVYAYGNTFQNASQFYGATHAEEAPVVDIAGQYRHIMIWGNTVLGGGPSDTLNPLFVLDNQP